MMSNPLKTKFFYLFAFAILLESLNVNAGTMSFGANCIDCIFGFIRVEDSVDRIVKSYFLNAYINSGICRMINRVPDNQKTHLPEYGSCPSMQNIKIPQTLQKIVYEEQDAPIYLIQQLHQLSLKYWKSMDPSLKKAANSLSSPLDFTTMKEYNLLAARLWDDLVRCNLNNPAIARRAFYLNDTDQFCASNTKSSQALLKSFSDLAKNFQLLLEGASIALAKTYSGEISASHFFKNLHPVLAEFLFINWSALFNEKEGDSLLRTSTLSLKSMEFTIHRLSPKSQQAGEIASIEDTYKLLVPSVLKAISLLNYENNEDNCSIYGLWPGLNQVVASFRPPL